MEVGWWRDPSHVRKVEIAKQLQRVRNNNAARRREWWFELGSSVALAALIALCVSLWLFAWS